MLIVLSLPPWVRHSWLMIWNWLNFTWLIPGRIEENIGHTEGLHLRQPISQECGAREETTTAEGNGEVQAVGEIEVQDEAMGKLKHRNTELTLQLERRMKDKEYFSQSKRQTSLQIEKLVRQNLALKDQVNLLKVQQTSLQLENSDLKIKLQEANSKSLGNIPRDDTVAFGSNSNRGWGYHPSDATSAPSGNVNIEEEPTEINGRVKINEEMKLDKTTSGSVGCPIRHRRSTSLVTPHVQDFNAELRSENAQLKSDRKDLGDAVVSLNNENELLYGNNENLRNKCKKLNSSNKDLISFNKELIVENEELDKENESLNGENEVLSADNIALIKENDTLEDKNKSLQAEKKNLVIENKDLIEERKSLVVKNRALKKENKILVNDKNTLATQNQTLTVKNEALLHEKDALTAQKETLERLAERNEMLTEENGNPNGGNRGLRPGSPRVREKFGK